MNDGQTYQYQEVIETVNMEGYEPHDDEDKFISLNLANGTLVYKPEVITVSEEKKKIPKHFLLFNMSGARPIQLYPKQMLEVLRQLPKAYTAVGEGDTSYKVTIVQSKTQMIFLEVSEYKDRMYLFLKKMFKPEEMANDPDQCWLYTRSNVSFDPKMDQPTHLLKFILDCVN